MPLKEFTKEIFTQYGFTENDINVYLGYLRVPRATISEVALSLAEEIEIDHDTVAEITVMLEEKGFVKKIEGIIDRYVPLQPYFELFTAESEKFRDAIGKIKDNILADQSNRFEKLEAIQGKSINEVETAVANQIKAFFDDSDAKNSAKKERIENAKGRFADTTKTLESDLHGIIEADYSRLTDDVNKQDKEADDLWDANTGKFTSDNDSLNNTLTEITKGQVISSKEQENKIHGIVDLLQSDLNNISSVFVSDNEGRINKGKDDLNKLIGDLLGDFSNRLSTLETELKKDLDGHVDRHQNISNELKPKMEQILEKYLERMDRVVTELKEKITNILNDHKASVQKTTDTLQEKLKSTIEMRHKTLSEQTTTFKNTALTVIDNLLEHANRFTDFSDDMAHKGFLWMGKKAKYKARNEGVIQDVLQYTAPMKDGFITESDTYISNTRGTTDQFKSDITEIMGNENTALAGESSDLDSKAQATIDAQLETLATDMAGEIDSTLQTGVKDCSDTTIKLKDSLENSIKTHHKTFDDSINRHNEGLQQHKTDFDADIKRKNESWVKDVEVKVSGGKRDVSTEIEKQIQTINEHLDKTKNKNVEHSKTFATDVNETKTKQRALYDALLAKVRSDFDGSKANTSEKINAEIKLWSDESADMDTNLTNMLSDHKSKYEENAKDLENSLSTSTRDTIQNNKDAIADFTLEFMNAIDDSTELAESNEEKLKDIHTASAAIKEITQVTTWHTVGKRALINVIKDAIYRVKSSIIIVTPQVEPEILQLCSQWAYQKKAARFMLTTQWNLAQYGDIITKMKALGNIQFRNLNTQGEYYACTRDAEEVIICPASSKESEMIAMVSNQDGYAKLYSSVIGPMFLSNSRPLK